MTGAIRTALMLTGTETPPRPSLVDVALDQLEDVERAKALVYRLLSGVTIHGDGREFLAVWCGLEDGNASAQD